MKNSQFKINEKVAKALLFKGYYSVGKLKSPRINFFPLYPDHRILFSHIDKIKIIAKELAKAIKPWKFDLIASREAGGVPYGVATALQLNKGFLYLRKEPKGYNISSIILGEFEPGQRVVVVDDAMSTGGDKKKAIEELEACGLKVVGVAVITDTFYGEKYREPQKWLRENKKYKFARLVTWPGLMKFGARVGFFRKDFSGLILEQLNDPLAWQEKEENWKKLKELALKEKNLIFHESFKDIQ